MRRYIRDNTYGGCYFITFVLQDRQSSLLTDYIAEFRMAYRDTKKNYDFNLDAMVVLPDHVHMILTLPESSNNYSIIIASLKSQFSRRMNKEESISQSRQKKRERGIWQRRFWEHRIRDDLDYQRHIEYIHFNPVKHGYVNSPKDWQYSTLRKFIDAGIYTQDWGENGLFDTIDVKYD
ncbi:REP-associated tyrosine transposase [Psychrobacter phenylpyruvicus]|uniref:Transposase and inactivated derivatives n=1 Tax=Psychrobacter phenylpyruvicus TaxID=29432 RepID=A0A379LN13_9GAMM|nr:transposase [Psychrobacter phenylpyruvicus]SUD91970.1 Transposase and inactivated derivatives [Psychrobacter phenylpyruvicus]